MNPKIQELISDQRFETLSEVDMAELRSVRDQLQAAESDLSLVRRLTQGRLDIVGHETSRRSGSGDGDLDTSGLLFDLPEILADEPNSGGRGRVSLSEPGEVAHLLTDQLDGLVSPSELSSLANASDAEVKEAFDSLQSFEGELSTARRELHTRIDAIQHEIGRRYKDGEASTSDAFKA